MTYINVSYLIPSPLRTVRGQKWSSVVAGDEGRYWTK